MTSASPTGRSPYESDGRFSTLPSNATVVDPPESSANPVTTPYWTSVCASCQFVMPTLQPGRRPSTATMTIVPSARCPIAVRGSRPCSCTGVSASPALKIGLPFLTSVGPALTASVTDAHSVGSGIRTVTCVPTGSAANGCAAVPRATSTAPSAGTVVARPAPTATMVPIRSLRGAVGGNGSSTIVVPLTAGGSPPQTGVNKATEFPRGGSFNCDTGYQTPSGPCQRPYHGTRSAWSVALVSIPTDGRPGTG